MYIRECRLLPRGITKLNISERSTFLSAQAFHDEIYAYFEVPDLAGPEDLRVFEVFRTYEPMPDDSRVYLKYLWTVVLQDGEFFDTHHVYERCLVSAQEVKD